MKLRLKPNTNSAASYRIIDNTQSRIFTDPADGRLTEFAAAGNFYAATLNVESVTIRNGATVEIVDADRERGDRRGVLFANQLELSSNARMIHPVATITSQFGLELIVTNSVIVDAGSSIDVSMRGYLGGRVGANTDNIGRTAGNATVGGSTRRNGGSYGGLGAIGNTEGTANALYGSYTDPDDVGSGGGSDNGGGGNGGGLIRITTGALTLNGQFLANGGSGGFVGGGGSGGGIKIRAETISGSGAMRAGGGNGDNNSGGGGGGRIAVYYDVNSGFNFENTTAIGGGGLNAGGTGTVFIKQANETPFIVVRNSGRETPLPELNGEHLILDGAIASTTNLAVSSLIMTNGAVLTHPGADGNNEFRLEISVAGPLVISTNSRIDVSARGYLGGRMGANSGNTGRTIGNTTVGGSTRRNGGSYGGLGAIGNTETTVNAVYGVYNDPNELGSGGGSDGSAAGNGGGLVRIVANTIVLQGQILANGGNGGFVGGGGSGGGVRLQTGTLTGGGVIRANGGSGDGNSGGGGGGRITLYYDSAAGFTLANLQAFGGTGLRTGGPGTIYTKQSSSAAQFVVRGNGRETPLPQTSPTDHLLIDNATVSATNINLASLILTNGAVLTHPGAGVTEETRLEVSVNSLVIDASSRIDVSARGYLGGRSGGNSGNSGRTLGNSTVGASLRRNGGSYGGLGGFGNADQFVNPAYGSFSNPNELGSGGGSDGAAAGNGGGLIRITAGSVHVDGLIMANGGDGGFVGGGGAGGGIKIAADLVAGSGRLFANGGRGDGNSGSGGGGRIAIVSPDITSFAITNVQAIAGISGNQLGSPGTIYWQSPLHSLGQLFVDARGSNVTIRATPILSLAGTNSTALAANTLTDTNASFAPGSLIGLKLNPNSAQSATFTIIGNTTNAIFTDPSDGNMLGVSASGMFYSASMQLGYFAVQGGAIVELVDANQSRAHRRGKLRAATAAVLGGSLLTHPPSTINSQGGLELIVDDTLTVDATSRIDVSSRGYLGGRSGGNSGNNGLTVGNTPVGGSTRRNGGSHGGSGAFGNTGGSVAATYDDQENPNQPGGGGGSDGSAAGNGGGVIRLTARNLLLEGSLLANAGNGGFVGGGGAGGTIWLSVQTISGSGIIRASGGNGDGNSGAGGGGRIAVRYESAPAFEFENIAAPGGLLQNPGGAGTVFLIQTDYIVPPAEAGASKTPVIVNILLNRSMGGTTLRTHGASVNEVLLRLRGETGSRFILEHSGDLMNWVEHPFAVIEIQPGLFEAIGVRPAGEQGYFRVRAVPTTGLPLSNGSEVRNPPVSPSPPFSIR